MKKNVFTLMLVLFAICTQAQESQTAYNFLRLPLSAHVAGLGGENITIIEDDASIISSNPALLYSVSDKSLCLEYMHYMENSNCMGATFTKSAGKRGMAAASARFIDYGKMKETSSEGVILGDFSARDIALSGTFSYLLAENLTGGITGRFIASYIGGYDSYAAGVDLGLNYYNPNNEWSVSAVVKNLGGQLKAYDEEYDKIPTDVCIGVSKKIDRAPFRLSLTMVGLNHKYDKFISHFVAGIDVLLSRSIYLCGGYNFRRANEMKIKGGEEDESSHGAGISLGGGLQLERFKMQLAYAKYHVSSSSLTINVAYTL